MPSRWNSHYPERKLSSVDAPKPIRRTDGFTPSSMSPVIPPWIPKLKGARRTGVPTIPKAKKIIAGTHEDF